MDHMPCSKDHGPCMDHGALTIEKIVFAVAIVSTTIAAYFVFSDSGGNSSQLQLQRWLGGQLILQALAALVVGQKETQVLIPPLRRARRRTMSINQEGPPENLAIHLERLGVGRKALIVTAARQGGDVDCLCSWLRP